MLADHEATATIAVKDIEKAKRFYHNTLGLTPVPTPEPGVLSFKSGNSTVLVYQSQFAGTNRATAATWSVGDVDEVVSALKPKGVPFEHYDMPGLTLRGDVHVSDKMKAAWFKDPDGNILAVVSGRAG